MYIAMHHPMNGNHRPHAPRFDDVEPAPRQLLSVSVPGGFVAEKDVFTRNAWWFEVSHLVDGEYVRHELSLRWSVQFRVWLARVKQWTIGAGECEAATPRDAVCEAAAQFERQFRNRGRLDVDGLLEALDAAGVWSLVESAR